MSHQKKNSISAEGNLSQNTEAAIKLFPRVSKIKDKVPEKGPIDGDGEGGPPPFVLNYVVEVALNGFFITVTFDDPETPDLRYVCQDLSEVFEIMKGNF